MMTRPRPNLIKKKKKSLSSTGMSTKNERYIILLNLIANNIIKTI